MNHTKWIQLGCILLAGLALAAASRLHGSIRQEKKHLEIVADFSEVSSAASAPELKLLQAMPGGMRALAIDYLWIRSQELKQQGRFYDAKQLAELICKLQPRFPGVWVFHSWNMAFNISVTAVTEQERWKWVYDGVELLRDRGIQYNPRSLDLYFQLAWTYYFKIGGTTDDKHHYYKNQTAVQFHRILGAPPRSREVKDVEAWFARIANAPAGENELLNDQDIRAFIARARGLGLSLGESLLEAYNRWSDDPLAKYVGQLPAQPTNEAEQALQTLMADPALAGPRDAVVAYVRRHVLVHTYHMDVNYMLGLIQRYGPMDWRTPYAHGLYWSLYGVEHCQGVDRKSVQFLNTARIVLNSLKDIASHGRLTLVHTADGLPPVAMFGPDWRGIEAAHQAHLWFGQFISDEEAKTYEKLQDGHINFLDEAICQLWFAGRDKQARDLMQFIRDQYHPRNPVYSDRVSMDEFVIYTINKQEIPRLEFMRALVFLMVVRANDALVEGYPEEYNLYLQRSRLFYDRYDQERTNKRVSLPEFSEIHGDAAATQLLQMGDVLMAVRYYHVLPLAIRQHAYDLVAQPLHAKCEQVGLDFAKAFPEPPGMEAVRQRRQQRVQGG